MKRLSIIVLLALAAIATAQDPVGLRTLAMRFANESNLVYGTCPEGVKQPTECIIGTGSKELDKINIDVFFEDLILEWTTPWFSANTQSFGRGANTYYGEVLIITMDISPAVTLIVLWYPD